MAENCRTNRITSYNIYGQGTICDWKQPFGYFFVYHATSAERLKKLAFCVVENLTVAGETVVALVCDQSVANV
jgi:hypothetical protein